jgi:hypothetical protein
VVIQPIETGHIVDEVACDSNFTLSRGPEAKEARDGKRKMTDAILGQF